jgi:hypothetical protein
MDEALGWTVYLSISAAAAFYVAGYVTRMALGTKNAGGAALADPSARQDELPADHETACLDEVTPPRETCRPPDESEETETATERASADERSPIEGETGPAADEATEQESETSSSWPPERVVSQPPLSCPPASRPPRPVLRSGLFLAERKTLPFHQTISGMSMQTEQTGVDDRRWTPEATRPSWASDGTGAKDIAGETEELLRLRHELRRLAQRQGELEARVEIALRRVASTSATFTGTARERTIGTLLEDLPRDVEAAVVTGVFGIPVQQAGPSRVANELAASLGPIKRMASEVAEIVAFPSRPRRIQVEDHQGVRLDCWLLDPNEDLCSVVLLRLPGPPDELEAAMKRIAAELAASNTPAYGHPVRTSSAS